MNDFFRKNRNVLWSFGIIWAFGVLLQMFESNAGLHLYINRFHAPLFDLFFKYLTWLGSGWAVAVVGLLLIIYKRYRIAFIFLTGNLLNTAVVQSMKSYFFPEVLRPAAYFAKGSLHLVSGVDMHLHYSFPSGHSATAFGIFVLMMFLPAKQWQKFLWLFIAILTAFSRVYLSQHFFRDILAGAFIGTAGMIFVFWIFQTFFPAKK